MSIGADMSKADNRASDIDNKRAFAGTRCRGSKPFGPDPPSRSGVQSVEIVVGTHARASYVSHTYSCTHSKRGPDRRCAHTASIETSVFKSIGRVALSLVRRWTVTTGSPNVAETPTIGGSHAVESRDLRLREVSARTNETDC